MPYGRFSHRTHVIEHDLASFTQKYGFGASVVGHTHSVEPIRVTARAGAKFPVEVAQECWKALDFVPLIPFGCKSL